MIECYEALREDLNHLKLHAIQGLSIISFLFARLYYIIALALISSIINTACINFIVSSQFMTSI